MKCPNCRSKNTKRVWSGDSEWHAGHQRCHDCNHQDHWGSFCDPPIDLHLPTGRARIVIE